MFNILASLLAGFKRLVRFVLRACLILVRWRVFFILCACATSGDAEQSVTLGTVLPVLGPDSQRQRRLIFPVLGFLLKTILCSVMNSSALIGTYLRQFLILVRPFLYHYLLGLGLLVFLLYLAWRP